MITIVIPEWVMWLIVAFLFVNAATVGIDMFVRVKIYKILLKRKILW
jgi:hypothetical protein